MRKDQKTEVASDPKHWWVWLNGYTYRIPKTARPGSEHHEPEEASDSSVYAPMTGKVTHLLVRKGDSVKKGDPLLKMEAMKMQYTLSAPVHGVVNRVSCKVGDVVNAEDRLIEIS